MRLKYLLSESARGEELSDEIDWQIVGINPRSVEFHDVLMIQGLKQMNLSEEFL